VAISNAVERNDLDLAKRHLARIRSGNPEGALTAESAFAMAQGDLSRLVALTAPGERRVPTSLRHEICDAWIAMGRIERCGDIGAVLPDVAKALLQRRPVRTGDLVALAQTLSDPWLSDLASWELLRAGRYEQLLELSKVQGTPLHGLTEIRPGNRLSRYSYAGRLAFALQKLGRRDEARAYWASANEAGNHALRSGLVASDDLLAIAANEAAQGRRGRALALLSRMAPERLYRLNRVHGELGEDPMFASLRGDPQFEALRRRHLAWREKEAREALALRRT
jgi:tetratricopeptide (TPR) repeat protein